ncbi:MAG: hypothetical protein AB1502_11805 [Thermodesulfobacteriota bacterium]
MRILTCPEKKKKFKKIVFEGGPGASADRAVVIRGAPNTIMGVLAEYQYLTSRFGRRDIDWKMAGQSISMRDNHQFDIMQIRLSDGTERTIFFDITEFFGKR